MTIRAALDHLAERIETLAVPRTISSYLGNKFRHDPRMSADAGASATRHFSFRVTNVSTRGSGRQGGRYERFMVELRVDYLDASNQAELTRVIAEDVGTINDVVFSSTNWDQTRTQIRTVGNESTEIATEAIEQLNKGARATVRFPLEVYR
jgi:hypothetical protein